MLRSAAQGVERALAAVFLSAGIVTEPTASVGTQIVYAVGESLLAYGGERGTTEELHYDDRSAYSAADYRSIPQPPAQYLLRGWELLEVRE